MRYKYYGTAAYEGIPAVWCECGICERARKAGGRNIMTRSQQTIDDKLLIDFSADTFMHMLMGLPLRNIYSCIITHSHSDHFYPHDIVARIGCYAHPKKEIPFNIYLMPKEAETLEACIKTEVAATDRIRIHKIKPYNSFYAEGYRVTPLKANHDPASEPVIYLIEKDGKCVLHANDTGYLPDETWEYLEKNPRHINLASFDCTSVKAFKDCDKTDGHMNLPTVKNVRDRLIRIGMIDDSTICVLNHFSHNGLCIYDDLAEPAKKNGFICAYDGLELEF